ncbi:MAG TPA: hypothetical protein VKC60_15275, partial [Opitutaceae bacterium]|nr:hypothetical protein [Opitutaceae bacterium]
GTVVWHRWVRDPEAKTLAFDRGWFEKNIVSRLKGSGANFLRFHLGLPPEAFLDLCDHDGLAVQLEWPFFHGVKASSESMQEQWRAWLDVAMRHPSVFLIHPWNETEGDELKTAWAALNAVLPEYPPLVISHRDVVPIHKYWWSLFENLGLYYDSAAQFGQPVMVDEFGGNYLDGKGNPGLYPSVRESYLRFLGRDPTREMRLQFHAEANARVAEYWRRLDVAGVAPFCILSSPQDGNTWFLGELKNPEPKPVWEALAATYAPMSVSLNVWNRNYSQGETVELPLHFFNDTGKPEPLSATVRITSGDGSHRIVSTQSVAQTVQSHRTTVASVRLTMPKEVGDWIFEAELNERSQKLDKPVVSSWHVRTLAIKVPLVLTAVAIAVPEGENEILQLLQENKLKRVTIDDPQANVIVTSLQTWNKLVRGPGLRAQLQSAVDRGVSVVLLDIGPRDLGQGYKKGDLGPLEGAPRIVNPRVEHVDLFSGVKITFTEAAEPESHLHPALRNDELWAGLPKESTWLWNGLRAGLVVPAADLEVSGLNSFAFVSVWAARGADERALTGGNPYYAYELAGFFAFSSNDKDKGVVSKLRDKVKLLAEDAPALQDRINPNAPIEAIDLQAAYKQSANGKALQLTALANCGKNLTRVPIAELTFGPAKGKVILSQVLTAGRLIRQYQEPGFYGIRYDPAAEQFTLNMIAAAVRKD